MVGRPPHAFVASPLFTPEDAHPQPPHIAFNPTCNDDTTTTTQRARPTMPSGQRRRDDPAAFLAELQSYPPGLARNMCVLEAMHTLLLLVSHRAAVHVEDDGWWVVGRGVGEMREGWEGVVGLYVFGEGVMSLCVFGRGWCVVAGGGRGSQLVD
jgi:hypothetical protein